MKKLLHATSLSILFPFLLTACFQQTTVVPEENDTIPKAEPTRQLSWEGVIEPVSNSMIAEGTHVLLSEDNEFVAELLSNTINLEAYEGKTVQLTGIDNQTAARLLIEVTKITKVDTETLVDLWDTVPALVAEYEPDLAWEDAIFELLESSEQAGTATIIAELDDEFWTIKLVRKEDPLVGEWEVYSIYESLETELEEMENPTTDENEDSDENEEEEDSDETEDMDEDGDEDEVDENDDEDTPIIKDQPVVIDPKASESSIDESTLHAVISDLPEFLVGEEELSSAPSITLLEFASPNFVYVTYATEETEGMLLLTYTSQDNGINFSRKATFIPGETSDWEISDGVNSAKNLAKDIFENAGDSWTFKGNVQEGYSIFDWSATDTHFEVPYNWYYWIKGNSVAFSTQPVEEENTLVEIYYSSKSVDEALETFSGTIETESDITIGDYTGTKQTLDDGTVRYAVDYGDTVLIVEADGDYASTTENLLSSVTID